MARADSGDSRREDRERADPGRTDPELERAIAHLLDADAADWSIATGLLASRPQQLEALRVVADVAAGCRRLQEAAATSAQPAPLFHWGGLEVREQVASGASADVYRAYDRALGIEVALKLHRAAPHSPTAARFLGEAHHLARVRQRNVVGVYGAALHDDRAGLWCEWIEGSSLTQMLREHGACAPAEAAYVGVELCAALEALHAAGILHGDLKPANVLRERGGRIVLVDLGAGGSPHEINSATAGYGTPAYLPPEVLAGAPRKPEHDLYALGRLIETLLAGPDAEAPASVHPALQRVLARATAADPALRYAQAAELRRDLTLALAKIHGVDVSPTQPARRYWLIALAAAGVIAFGLLAARHWIAPPWSTDLQLLRRTDAGATPLTSGATLAQGDRLVLDLRSSRPVHVYVLNEDAGGDLHVLFPLRGLDLANPLPAGGDVRLPGSNSGREFSWEITSSGQREEFLVVLASAPLAPIQRLVDSAALAVDVERGVGRVRAEAPGGVTLRGAHLNALLEELGPDLRNADRTRIQAYRFNDSGSDSR
jgi:tRNA A-37 threonylcarbamoyl transferase component Bud32